MAEKKPGIVYVITNPSIPGKVNIGHVKSTPDDPSALFALKNRIRTHSSASVPEPYKLHYAVAVDDISAERLLHRAFGFVRPNNREFFEVDPDKVKAAMQLILIGGSDKIPVDLVDALGIKTTQVGKLSDVSRKPKKPADEPQFPATETGRARYTFADVGIAKGAELVFVENANIKVNVFDADSQKVMFCTQGFDKTPMSLGKAARKVFEKIGHPAAKWKGIRGATYWKYNGQILADMFEGDVG